MVLTEPHPPRKLREGDNDYPPYYSRFHWLAERWEELIVIGFLASVFLYVSCFYATVWTFLYPVRQVFAYAWDVVFAAFVVLRVIGKLLPRPPSRKKIADMTEADAKEANAKRKAAAK